MPPELKDKDLIDKVDVEIEKIPAKELNEREEGVPNYKTKLDYDENLIARLKKEIFKGYQQLKDERDGEHLDTRWDGFEAQYNGDMEDDANVEFNLDTSVTKVKVDSLRRLSLKAFIESDPMFFDISKATDS